MPYYSVANINLIIWLIINEDRKAHPTRMPSSISVGETLSPNPTTNCNNNIAIIYNIS